MNDRDIEQLLKLSNRAQEFQREVGDMAGESGGAPLRLAPHTRRHVVRFRWIAGALAACIAVSVTIILWQTGVSKRSEFHMPDVAARGPVAKPLPAITPEDLPAPAAGAQDDDQVHVVVALYRNDSNESEQCPECWCVAQWSAQWSDGRSINEVQDEELVGASMAHACVLDPKRVVVVGLSGPATSMPKSDQQARELSLCLMGELPATSENCVPNGVDYCMASWNR